MPLPRPPDLLLLILLAAALTMGAAASTPPPASEPASEVAMPPGVEKLGAGLLLCHRAGGAIGGGAASEPAAEPRILLLKRRSKHHDGAWGLPGGNVEPGDGSLLAAATREAHEELGAGGVPPFVVRARLQTRRGKRGQKVYYVFVAEVDEEDARGLEAQLNEEHSEARWFGAGEVARRAAAAAGGDGGGGGGGASSGNDDGGEQVELHPVVALAMREAGGAEGLRRLLAGGS